jgi:4a-hydroxytetrahydrobiopterin dehydratase
MRSVSRILGPRVLAPDALAAALERLPRWRASADGRALERVVPCGSFAEAIAFVGRVALLAEAAAHHPDLDVRDRTVRVALTTRQAEGVTERDTDLAGWIERVVP